LFTNVHVMVSLATRVMDTPPLLPADGAMGVEVLPPVAVQVADVSTQLGSASSVTTRGGLGGAHELHLRALRVDGVSVKAPPGCRRGRR